ncbi:hypothetical protein SAMN05444671_3866 [Flavobacterium sp. CF108]|jgi:hypothetical protein|uniref:hypothetical protein n=1 Tax=unclassified Flavobacterium TaxID=196869 RepID=UPI0008B7F2F9|nr:MULTISPECIES: hypothetical protein [unclassified Flavobacterium]SEO96476.1 hypothetical protein SAMN04487978_4105 [Flavobacterium sp. fv08]SHH81378.1 hypothetical protein SAMN05444671_3866 [Flavobacterium sp. CF108]
MKRFIVLILICVSQINFAQSTFPTDGSNVGIGTINPTQKLEVVGGGLFQGAVISSVSGDIGGRLRLINSSKTANGASNDWVIYNMAGSYGNSLQFWAYDNLGCGTGLCANRFTIMDSGNVGIGTNAPTAKLDVNSSAVAATFRSTTNSVPVTIVNTGTTLSSIGFKGSTSLTEYNVRVGADGNDFAAYTANAERMRINSIGNTGIGTANPLAKLEVYNGNILVRNAANVDNESNIMIAHSIKYADKDTYGTSLRTITQSAGTNAYGMQFFTQESYVTGQTEKLRILGNGNVGIGEISPKNKLDVKGTIHSQEVKVDMQNWSDFVFKKEYNLPTLEEVEKHINEKGHLENIPSEKEVLKNGINLGEMNAKLLQKIEEMTLYMIEMKKDISVLKQENKELKSQIKSN